MLKDLKRFSEPFYKYHGRRAYGKEFVIKKRGRRSEYAIYVKRQNKMQREDDRLVIERLNQVDKMGDFLQSYRWLISQVRNRMF